MSRGMGVWGYGGITGLILAGGRSKRFGSDKAQHKIDGIPMIERVHTAILRVASPILVSVANESQQYDLPARHIPDIYPHCGPLAGLHAGLHAAETEWVLVVAVDLPYIESASLEKLLMRRTDDVDAVVAQCDGKVQPLCGCYRTSLASRIEERLASKKLAVMAFLDTIRVDFVDIPEMELCNFNRPADGL